VGKDADLVIWSGHPFSVYSRVERTIIEGETYFDRENDTQMRAALERERAELEKADVNKPAGGVGASAPPIPRERIKSHLDDAEGEDGGNH
jgi:hypothetical protein